MTDERDYDEAENLMERHKALLGSVTIGWNDCTHFVFEIFMDLSGMPVEKADKVFFGIRNDRTQRKIVRDLAGIALEDKPELRDKLVRVLVDLDKTAGVRNEATHSAWAIQMQWLEGENGIPYGWKPPKLVKVKAAGDEDDGFTERFTRLEAELQGAGSELIDVLRKLRGVPGQNV